MAPSLEYLNCVLTNHQYNKSQSKSPNKLLLSSRIMTKTSEQSTHREQTKPLKYVTNVLSRVAHGIVFGGGTEGGPKSLLFRLPVFGTWAAPSPQARCSPLMLLPAGVPCIPGSCTHLHKRENYLRPARAWPTLTSSGTQWPGLVSLSLGKRYRQP